MNKFNIQEVPITAILDKGVTKTTQTGCGDKVQTKEPAQPISKTSKCSGGKELMPDMDDSKSNTEETPKKAGHGCRDKAETKEPAQPMSKTSKYAGQKGVMPDVDDSK